MKLVDAIKTYFGGIEDTDESNETILKKNYKKKKKKKKGTSAGSYFKKKRKGYEEALEEAGDY